MDDGRWERGGAGRGGHSPIPLCFLPPKGTLLFNRLYWFTHTWRRAARIEVGSGSQRSGLESIARSRGRHETRCASDSPGGRFCSRLPQAAEGGRARATWRACVQEEKKPRADLSRRAAPRHSTRRVATHGKASVADLQMQSEIDAAKAQIEKKRGAKDSPCRPRAPATRACTGSRRLRESRAGWAGRGRCEMVGRAGRAGRGKSAHQSIFAHTQRRGDAEQRLGARASALDGRSLRALVCSVLARGTSTLGTRS